MIVANKQRFYEALEQYRFLYVGGAFGTGKTLLTVAIAEKKKKKDYRVLANFPLVFNSNLSPDLLDGLDRCVIILDEAGSRLLDSRAWNSKSSAAMLEVMDYARKQDLFFLMPSHTPVDKRARDLVVARNQVGMRFFSMLGLDRLFWHYFAQPVQDEKFGFMLLAPYAYFDLYDTKAIPGVYGDGVSLVLQKFQEQFAFDEEKAAAARDRIFEILENGQTLPALRPGGPSIEGPTGRGAVVSEGESS